MLFEPDSFVNFVLSGQAVLLVPPVDIFLLAFLSSFEVVGVKRLLKRMPHVEVMIIHRIHAIEHDTAIRLGVAEWFLMTFVIVFFPACGYERLGYAEILYIFVVLKSFAEDATLIAKVQTQRDVTAENFEPRLVQPAHFGCMTDRFSLEMRNYPTELTHPGF